MFCKHEVKQQNKASKSSSLITLYKLYALPVRVCSTHEDMHYLRVISVPVSHILNTRDPDMQFPWVISLVPVRICSTRESYPQYPWVYFWSLFQAVLYKCPKHVTKYQNDSKAEFTGSPSETASDSDSSEGTEGEDKVSASSVIYSSKNY